MFKKTYGILYEQNANVFIDLFQELEIYYSRGAVSFLKIKIFFFFFNSVLIYICLKYKLNNFRSTWIILWIHFLIHCIKKCLPF